MVYTDAMVHLLIHALLQAQGKLPADAFLPGTILQ